VAKANPGAKEDGDDHDEKLLSVELRESEQAIEVAESAVDAINYCSGLRGLYVMFVNEFDHASTSCLALSFASPYRS